MDKLEKHYCQSAEGRNVDSMFNETVKNFHLFETAVKHAYTPVIITDAELDMPGPRIVFINAAFAQMTGYSENELLGKTPRIFQGPKTDRGLLERLRRDLSQGLPFHGEAINYRKDGTEYYVEWMIAPIRNENKEITHFVSVQRDLTEQKKAEEALKKAHDELEEKVKERTRDLVKVNEQLTHEIEERKQALRELSKREAELKEQTQQLEDVNAALRVLLKQREDDKTELEYSVLSNVKKSIMPCLDQLKKTNLNTFQKNSLEHLNTSLKSIVSPFIRKLSSQYLELTPTEIQVASLIKEGKRTKEIADFLNLSDHTIITHRSNIRRKLGLKNERINLSSYLQSIT